MFVPQTQPLFVFVLFCFVFLIQGYLTVRPSNQQMAALPVVGFQAHVTIPVCHRGTWKSGLMLAYQAVYRLKLPLLFGGQGGVLILQEKVSLCNSFDVLELPL